MEAEPKDIIFYELPNGKRPFVEWLESLDPKAQTEVNKALDKIRQGLLTNKNCEPVGAGVREFKVFFGPGYRIYFGQRGSTVVVLCGGVKKTQDKDILKAKEYWADYEKRESSNQ